MKTVLIIAPQFSPSSYPPTHRVRYFTNHLEEFGWFPIVSTVEPDFLEEPPDWQFANIIPDCLKIVRSKALSFKWTRKLGIGDLGIRAFWHQLQSAREICRQQTIDLLFIPGPPWHTFLVGRIIKKELGIPYVMDYIDPWVMSLGKDDPPWTKAYWFRKMAIALEPFAVKETAQITAVSAGTNEGVRARYPTLSPSQFTSIPYGGELTDFEYIKKHPQHNSFFCADDRYFNVVYVGAMLPKGYETLRALFEALKALKHSEPGVYQRFRFFFVGTTYDPDAKKGLVEPMAIEMGVSDVVTEHRSRIPFLDAITVLSQADATLVLGTTEQHYTASKLYPGIMANRPLLAIFHEASSVVNVLKETDAGLSVIYNDSERVSQKVDDIKQRLIQLTTWQPNTNWRAFEQYSARSMTHRLTAVFDKALAAPN
ncbi:MAG: hypothetical protein AB8B99_12600 [Phormidesmis sp.]